MSDCKKPQRSSYSDGKQTSRVSHGFFGSCERQQNYASSFHQSWDENQHFWVCKNSKRNFDALDKKKKILNNERVKFIQDSLPAHEYKIKQDLLMRELPLFVHKDVLPSSSPDLNPCDY